MDSQDNLLQQENNEEVKQEAAAPEEPGSESPADPVQEEKKWLNIPGKE